MLPKKLERATVYESEWINLYTDKIQMPSGDIIEDYHILGYPKGGVNVVVVNKKQEICLIKSVRYATGTLEWEVPGGWVEENEEILKTAEREFFEETGFHVQNLKLVYSLNPANAMSDRVTHTAFGELDESQNQEVFDTDEVKEVHWLSEKKVRDMLKDNEIKDSFTLIALMLYLGRFLSD